MIKASAGSGRLRILNFGENLHEQLMSPRYFEKYFFPFYEKRVGQLRSAGIYTHVHLDGFFKHLLPQLRHLPFDGLEALTPVPQGDVTLIWNIDLDKVWQTAPGESLEAALPRRERGFDGELARLSARVSGPVLAALRGLADWDGDPALAMLSSIVDQARAQGGTGTNRVLSPRPGSDLFGDLERMNIELKTKLRNLTAEQKKLRAEDTQLTKRNEEAVSQIAE